MKEVLKWTGVILILGFLIPQNLQMPVKGASSKDYNKESFWYYPWGKSVTHKGVDIFSKKGTPVFSSTNGFVYKVEDSPTGGKSVWILGPKWRIHYYAHLNETNVSSFSFVSQNTQIGTVGNTGNAKGKAPHLHYMIRTLFPYPWNMDRGKQGIRKMFYLNPIEYFDSE